MCDGPWYESVGPTAVEVRVDVLKELNIVKVNKQEYDKEKDEIIKRVLMEVIPDNRKDFGSWRGYASFGLKKKLAIKVRDKIRVEYSKLDEQRNKQKKL
jgi:hypothetical protein|tara:strand:- start:649 stop:945 length:297 start_codon:yes stop_codon:yes gene_type:complete